MRSLILILFVGLMSSCTEKVKVEFEAHIPKHSADELMTELDSLYQNQDTLGLIAFFNDWSLDVKSNDRAFVDQNIRVKSVYEIYRAFYIPNSPFNLGRWEAFHIPESELEYFVIQNKIYYSILPDVYIGKIDWETLKIDSIDNFKPKLEHLAHNRLLYLTLEYKKALNGFLGFKYKEFGAGNIMSPSLPVGESEARYDFLKKHIHLLHGHWGRYWHLETHPEVYVVVINSLLTDAKVFFRYGYQGGEAALEKKRDGWMLKSSKATWIE